MPGPSLQFRLNNALEDIQRRKPVLCCHLIEVLQEFMRHRHSTTHKRDVSIALYHGRLPIAMKGLGDLLQNKYGRSLVAFRDGVESF